MYFTYDLENLPNEEKLGQKSQQKTGDLKKVVSFASTTVSLTQTSRERFVAIHPRYNCCNFSFSTCPCGRRDHENKVCWVDSDMAPPLWGQSHLVWEDRYLSTSSVSKLYSSAYQDPVYRSDRLCKLGHDWSDTWGQLRVDFPVAHPHTTPIPRRLFRGRVDEGWSQVKTRLVCFAEWLCLSLRPAMKKKGRIPGSDWLWF